MSSGLFRFFAITFGFLVCGLAVFRLWQLANEQVNTWWTPVHLALPLDATTDRFEVLVGGTPLPKAIEAKRLSIASDGTVFPLSASDVLVRVNNHDRNRVARMPGMMALAAAAGGGFVLFVIGLVTPLIGAFRPHGLVDLHLAT
jgi:hypothetical protein